MTDDLDPTQEANTTVSFGVDGVTYEIDLSQDNADALGATLAPYVGAARRTGGRSGSVQSAKGSSTRRSDSAAVRAWGQEHGISLNTRGRIPSDVQDKYDAAH